MAEVTYRESRAPRGRSSANTYQMPPLARYCSSTPWNSRGRVRVVAPAATLNTSLPPQAIVTAFVPDCLTILTQIAVSPAVGLGRVTVNEPPVESQGTKSPAAAL